MRKQWILLSLLLAVMGILGCGLQDIPSQIASVQTAFPESPSVEEKAERVQPQVTTEKDEGISAT